MATIMKPIILDETAQKIDATLQEIRRAILPDLSYATKVSEATSGNLASLTDDGNISDSGKKASDFADAGDLVNLSDEVGINLWDEEWEVGGLNTSNGTNSIGENDRIRAKNYIKVLPNTEYCVNTLTLSPNNGCQIWFYDENKVGISRISGAVANRYVFTPPPNTVYIRFNFYAQYGADYKNDICINRSNPAINGTYYPFRGLRKQISVLSNEALDIKMLGWTVPKDKLSVKNYIDDNRIFHQIVGRIDLGSLDWSYNGGVGVFISSAFALTGNLPAIDTNAYIYKYATQEGREWSAVSNKRFVLRDGLARLNYRSVAIKDNDYSNATAFKNAMNGVYLYYELAEEILIPMDGNEFSANLGDAWNSSTTYKVGDYCIYSNALYKCKVQNSNTVPTNTTYWTRVTVGEELGTINRDFSHHIVDMVSYYDTSKFVPLAARNRNTLLKQGHIAILCVAGSIVAGLASGSNLSNVISVNTLVNLLGVEPLDAFGVATTSGKHIVRLYKNDNGMGIFNNDSNALAASEYIYGELIFILPN